MEDAKLFVLNTLYKHLEKPDAHARLLFADFSSAFNKMQPHILMERLASHLNLPDRLLLLILDVLTERVQQLLTSGQMSRRSVSRVVCCHPSYSSCTWIAAGLPRRTGFSFSFPMTLFFYLCVKVQSLTMVVHQSFHYCLQAAITTHLQGERIASPNLFFPLPSGC